MVLSNRITLRILRWGDYLGLSLWVLGIVINVLIRDRQGNLKIRVMLPQPRHTGSHQKLEETRKEYSPITSGESMALLTSWFWSNNTDFGFLTSRLWENKFLFFYILNLWLICYISPRNLISPHSVLCSCQESLPCRAKWVAEHKPAHNLRHKAVRWKAESRFEGQIDICLKGQGK